MGSIALVLRADVLSVVNAIRGVRSNPRAAALVVMAFVAVPVFLVALWIAVSANAAAIQGMWPQLKVAGVGGTAFFGMMRGFRVLPLSLDKAFSGWLAVLPVSTRQRLAAAVVAATSQIAFWAAPFAASGWIVYAAADLGAPGRGALAAAIAYAAGIVLGYVLAFLAATRPWVHDEGMPPSDLALAARMRFRPWRRARRASERGSLAGLVARAFDRLDRAAPRWIAHWAWGDDRLRNGLIALAAGLVLSQGWSVVVMVETGETSSLPVVAAGFAHMAFIVACLAKPAGTALVRVSGLDFGRASLGVARLGTILSALVFLPSAASRSPSTLSTLGTAATCAAGLVVLDALYLASAMRLPDSTIAGIVGYFAVLAASGLSVLVLGGHAWLALLGLILYQGHRAHRRYRGHGT